MFDLDIGAPGAIEAKEEYEWNNKENAESAAVRITDLNSRLFGDKAPAGGFGEGFTDSLATLGDMLEEARKTVPTGSNNSSKLYHASRGFRRIAEKKKEYNGVRANQLETYNLEYIHALDIGKTLYLEENGTKLYDLLAETYVKKGKTKEDLDRTLQQLKEKLGLKIVIPGKETAEEKAIVKVKKSAPYVKQIAEAQHAACRIEDTHTLKVTLATVLALRRMSVDPAHMDHTKIRSKALFAKAKTLMNTKAFKDLTDNMGVIDLAKKINFPGNFDKEFIVRLKELDQRQYEGLLREDDHYRSRLKASASAAVKKMNSTGQGVRYWGVHWGSNSGMYDRAVLAMQRASGEGVDAATTFRSVQTVKEYLSNKMTPRKSPSGRDRWKYCMEFLRNAMPPKEFEAYCQEVNEARKVKEDSPDYVWHNRPFVTEQRKRSKSVSVGKSGNIEDITGEDMIENSKGRASKDPSKSFEEESGEELNTSLL